MTRLFVPLVVVLAVACERETPPVPDIPEGPVEWSATASSDTAEVQVGDDFTLTIAVTHPPGGEPLPPPAAELEPFDVLDVWTEEASPIETRLHYRLAAYRLPADLEVPALAVRYRDDDGEIAQVETKPVGVRLSSSLTPEVTEIHDIKDPIALMVPRDWGFLAGAVLAVLVMIAGYLIYRKLRKEPEAAPGWAPPPPPPDVEAEAALSRLAERGFIEKGEIAAFYTELTDIVKRYAGRRFRVPYLERTTNEILRDLGARGVSNPLLREILERADLVKFAKQMPSAEQAHASLAAARDLVRATRPVLAETGSPGTPAEATS